MPICFQLFRKGEDKPTSLNKLDEEFCQLLSEPVDKVNYVCNWYNYIGFKLASGETYDQIHQTIHDDRVETIARYEKIEDENRRINMLEAANWLYGGLERILLYMKEHYTPNSFYESKR